MEKPIRQYRQQVKRNIFKRLKLKVARILIVSLEECKQNFCNRKKWSLARGVNRFSVGPICKSIFAHRGKGLRSTPSETRERKPV